MRTEEFDYNANENTYEGVIDMATKMKIGYIVKSSEGFSFREAAYTRKINSRGDKIYSKMLLFPVDYDEVVDNTEESVIDS